MYTDSPRPGETTRPWELQPDGAQTTPPSQPPPQSAPPQSPPPSPRARADARLLQLLLPSLLVLIAFGAGWFGNAFVNRPNYVAPTVSGKTNEETVLVQAWNDIVNNFVATNNIDQQKMAYAAIQAMIGTLNDPGHTRFETAKQYQQEQSQLNNQPTVGIGVTVSGGGTDPVTIETVLPNSPAEKAGLQPGDQITAVNGTNVKGDTLDQVVALIKGPKGGTVNITIYRPSTKATQTFSIVRAEISVKDVYSYIIPGTTIEDIQITEFGQNTNTQLIEAIKAGKAQNVTGIVLDLRDNPGGYLDQAVNVVSQFVPSGQGKNVLILKSRTSQQPLAVQAGGLATNIPVAILVNHGTASAAEITAGSVNVNRPQVPVIGNTTFGTGTVLSPYQLADGSVLILGTQEFLLPDGTSIYHTGLTPTQQVDLPTGVTPITALRAQELHLTGTQILQSQDAQLIRAIQDLSSGK